MAAQAAPPEPCVLRLRDLPGNALEALLAAYRLRLQRLAPDTAIAGSYWGDDEAGLVGDQVLARPDTPLHSILHEACHVICMDPESRAALHTDVGDGLIEENATCYLQILLAERIPGFGRERMQADMDAWGYSFRLGNARAWFEQDAEEALAWLQHHGVVDASGQPTGARRESLAPAQPTQALHRGSRSPIFETDRL